jgi:integrase
MADLSRKRERSALAERREPYWQRVADGAYLGFRRGPNTWLARFRGKAKDAKQQYHAIGPDIEYDEAMRRAVAWLSQLTSSPVRVTRRGTVREALEAYMADLERAGRPDAAKEALWRFKVVVWGDQLAGMALEDVTLDDMLEWRDRQRTDGKGRARQNRSLNRHVRAVVAGLNRANKLGHIGNPEAWRLDALPDDTEEGGTAVFLTPEQRKGLILSAEDHAGRFFRGLELSGARPKELAAARIADLSGDTLKLSHRKGRPPKLRVRVVVLGAAGAEFFKQQAKRKLPAALLFTEDGETPWRAHYWARRFREAVRIYNKTAKGKARIPAAASAYSFRHARISELLQVHGIDPLTVAQQCGTSLVMIEKAYHRFIATAMRDKLKAVKGA